MEIEKTVDKHFETIVLLLGLSAAFFYIVGWPLLMQVETTYTPDNQERLDYDASYTATRNITVMEAANLYIHDCRSLREGLEKVNITECRVKFKNLLPQTREAEAEENSSGIEVI